MLDNNLVVARIQPLCCSLQYNLVAMENKAGEWLRRHRKANDLLQSEVAERARVSVSYISTLERGQKHSTTDAALRPERDKAVAIARAVQGNPDELLLLYGYAPASMSADGKPQTLDELLTRLEALGVENFHAINQDALREATPDQLQEVLDAVKFAIEITLQRQQKELLPPNDTYRGQALR